MSKTAWPTAIELSAYLAGAGFDTAGVFVNLDYDTSIKAAIDWFEALTCWYPFLTAPTAIQIVVVAGSPSGGTFTLLFGSSPTSALAWNATPGQVQAALEAIVAIGVGKVTVAGNSGGPWTVTLDSSITPDYLTLGTNSLTGGSAPTVVTGEIPLTHDPSFRRSLFLNTGFSTVTGVFVYALASDTLGSLQSATNAYTEQHFREDTRLATVALEARWLLPAGLWAGGPRSVSVIGRRGWGTTIPEDVWNLVMRKAADLTLPQIFMYQFAQGGMATEWRKGDVQEAYTIRSSGGGDGKRSVNTFMGLFAEMLLADADDIIARYYRGPVQA